MFTTFKRYRGLTEGKETCRKHVAHCCSAEHQNHPHLGKQHSNATRIIHSRVLSREHRAELEFRRGIAASNTNYTHSHRF